MEERHMWIAVRYVERNPVRARMVARAEEYLWSSAAAHCGLRDDILLSKEFPPPNVIPNWSEWLKVEDSETDVQLIRRHLSSGRPWASPEFVQQLEALTGRRVKIPGQSSRTSHTNQTGKLWRPDSRAEN